MTVRNALLGWSGLILVGLAIWLFSGAMARDAGAPSVAGLPPGTERTVVLSPGPFAVWPGTTLGQKRSMDSDIYDLQCVPILAADRVLVWVDLIHVTNGQVFVEPCVEHVGGQTEDPHSSWTFATSWFEATLDRAAAEPRVQLRRLELDGWNHFSNAVPCGGLVAYWSLEPTPSGIEATVTAHVAGLLDEREYGRGFFANLRLDTDSPDVLAEPIWDADCRFARFEGSRFDLEPVHIVVG